MRWNVSLDFEECSEFSLYKINDRVSNEDSNFYCLLNELWIQSKSVYLCIRQYSYHFLIKIIIYISIFSLYLEKNTHIIYISIEFSPSKGRGSSHSNSQTFQGQSKTMLLQYCTMRDSPREMEAKHRTTYIFKVRVRPIIFYFYRYSIKSAPREEGRLYAV